MGFSTAAVPGLACPGAAWPGSVVAAAAANSHLYKGSETLVYPDYIDTGAGGTLVAAPNGTYQIAPAGLGVNYGHAVPPPDGNWVS